MIDLFNYQRRKSSIVHVGALDMGGENPIRIQSMTTTDTNDTQACIDQAERIIKAGGELVRLTTQGRREAENMKNIRDGLRLKGYKTPLVADVHFNPNVADIAARHIEKVRVNPGNYVDPARKFIKIDYTDEEYAAELRKIEERFVPFLDICKAHHTAIRIGVNHGSLSDRIRNRYGDTPEGIVESCMEFLRICEKEDFHDVVISIKSSNTMVMVRSVRLLVEEMEKENMCYPLHLGVTEAGEGEDGRIKSAVGIGALLADGIGDTVRVSLSEEPEEEIPVARHLVNHFNRRAHHVLIPGTPSEAFCWTCPTRRPTAAVGNIGGEHVPVVISSIRKPFEEPFATTSKSDYLYLGGQLPSHWDADKQYILDFNVYVEHREELKDRAVYPIFPINAMPFVGMVKAERKFLVLQFGTPAEEYISCLEANPEVVVVCMSNHANRTGEQRALVHEMMNAGLKNPVIFSEMYQTDNKSDFLLDAAADLGALLTDGLADGIWLMNDGKLCPETIEETAFGILQAARLRTSKTEYISCPGCGRTLYDLRETIAKIKAATSDMKGLKIGIMGCIVNGPGEMADADYGYVGAGPGRVSLYRKQVCVEHNIPEEEAVEHLLALIRKEKESLRT
ncbi:4-hydroxy-3-methylbut-2-en-1-yl diphosphate synthase [Prevotella sp. oral taxon 376]|uniref:4-hydroxy-3-methylbut-2-en-1-yl diphosphate synthase n=1 Tax=Prevotella sp. oral taxon 376 TaxID=712466 RepID=UPI000D1F52AD|nr:4-hydroxy-3-methylbut-2-en-1-yl diphosphate synthase [Prevotella sp. oral taxon 376]PTL33728.1 4-hydroxy-3-methylbut-2-en-1-yl diphosphate synthase [Prevotella sp. oral taxon 376]